MATDYDALAAQFGGADGSAPVQVISINGKDLSPSSNNTPLPDYDAIAANLGGSSSAPDSLPSTSNFQGSKIGAVIQGIRDPITAAGQMLYNAAPDSVKNASDQTDAWLAQHTGGLLGNSGGGTFNQKVARDNSTYESARNSSGRGDGIDWGRGLGQMIATAPVATFTDGLGVPGLLGQSAVTGAGLGLLSPLTDQPENYWGEKALQAGAGAAFGVVGGKIVQGAGKILNPVLDAGKQALIDAGVNLTPGQLAGGMAHTIEDKLTSVPVLGDIIKGAQGNGIGSLNTAVYNRTLRPLADAGFDINVPTTVGRDAVDSVTDQVKNAYNTLLPKLSFTADPQFASELQNIKGMAAQLPPAQATQFNNILKNNLFNKMTPQGNMNGESLKAVESDLGTLAKGYQGDALFDNRQLGNAIQSTLESVRSSLGRTNPEFAPQLQKINESFANLVRLQKAAASTGAKDGVFTPAQLSQAVRASDSTVRKNAFARGQAFMQDLSDPAKSVMPSTIPDSGTAGRGFLGLGTAALAGGHFVNPAIPAVAGVAALPYTSAGQKIMQALITSRPQISRTIGKGLLDNAGTLGLLGVPAAVQNFNGLLH